MQLAHVHPMLVHFPIVLVLTALLFDVARVVRQPQAGPARVDTGTILLVLAGVAAIFTYVFGDLAYDIAIDSGVPEARLEGHEGWGTITAVVLVAIAVVRVLMRARGLDAGKGGRLAAAALSGAGSAMVLVTAWFGGQLVYELGVNVM